MVCKPIVKIMLAVASTLQLFGIVAAESTIGVTEENLGGWFESIERVGTNLILTARWNFLYSINEKNPGDTKIAKVGEKIILPEGSMLKVVERHHSLRFMPMSLKDGRKGFRVSKRGWRPRKGVTTGVANLVPADEKSDSSGENNGVSKTEGKHAMLKAGVVEGEKPDEKKCLKGLTLLPCEDQ